MAVPVHMWIKDDGGAVIRGGSDVINAEILHEDFGNDSIRIFSHLKHFHRGININFIRRENQSRSLKGGYRQFFQ